MLMESIKVIIEQMDRIEGKKKQKKETKIYENDEVMHEDLSKDKMMKSDDSEDLDVQLRQKLD